MNNIRACNSTAKSQPLQAHTHITLFSLCHTFSIAFLSTFKTRFLVHSIKPCHCVQHAEHSHLRGRFLSLSLSRSLSVLCPFYTAVSINSICENVLPHVHHAGKLHVRWAVNQCSVSINCTHPHTHSIININILKSMHIRTRSQNFTIYIISMYVFIAHDIRWFLGAAQRFLPSIVHMHAHI